MIEEWGESSRWESVQESGMKCLSESTKYHTFGNLPEILQKSTSIEKLIKNNNKSNSRLNMSYRIVWNLIRHTELRSLLKREELTISVYFQWGQKNQFIGKIEWGILKYPEKSFMCDTWHYSSSDYHKKQFNPKTTQVLMLPSNLTQKVTNKFTFLLKYQ